MMAHWIYLSASILELSLMAKATDLLAGHSGRLGFGGIISAAIGGYAYALLSTQGGLNSWFSLIAALIVAGVSGLGLAVPLLKLNADGYLMATFALQMAVVELANNLSFTGGALGIRNVPALLFPWWRSNADGASLVVLLAATAVGMVGLMAVDGPASKLGRMLHWLRDDYVSAIASGINPKLVLSAVCVLHCLLGACAGIGIVISQGYVGPHSFDLWLSLNVFTVVIVSGTGGPPFLMLLGSVIVVSLNEIVSTTFTEPTSVGPWQQMLVNCLLLFFLALRRRGLAGPLLVTGPSARSEG